VGVQARGRRQQISRKKTVLRTHIVQKLNDTLAMATEFEALDIAMSYLNEAERPHQQLAVLLGTHCIVFSIFLCMELKEDYKTFGVLVIPHLSENCVALFSVTEFVFGPVDRGMAESEPSAVIIHDVI
jgi:hypothetical protein